MSNAIESEMDSAVLVLLLNRGLNGPAKARNFLSQQGLHMNFWDEQMLSYFSDAEASVEEKGLCHDELIRIWVLVERRFRAVLQHKHMPWAQVRALLYSRVDCGPELAAILRELGSNPTQASYPLFGILLGYYVALLAHDLDYCKLVNGFVGAKRPDFDYIREKRIEEIRAARLSGVEPLPWLSELVA